MLVISLSTVNAFNLWRRDCKRPDKWGPSNVRPGAFDRGKYVDGLVGGGHLMRRGIMPEQRDQAI